MVSSKKSSTFATDLEINHGAIAQLVEQRTENPCVPGSIPGGTTVKNANDLKTRLLAFFLLSWTSNLATFDQHFDTFSPFLQGITINLHTQPPDLGGCFFFAHLKKYYYLCSLKIVRI